MEKNAAFQYYLQDGTCICDKAKITLEEAKQLFNDHYDSMVKNAKKGASFEAGVWQNGCERTDYGELLLHVYNPEVIETHTGPVLCEKTITHFRKF